MQRQYVGIDLHRRSTTVYRMTEAGDLLSCVRIPSQPFELAQAMADAGPEPEVVLESTYGWVRHEAPHDRAGGRAPPVVCRSRPLKLEAA